MVLHELSHAYHNYHNAEFDGMIRHAFNEAMASGKYQAVEYVCCPGQKVKPTQQVTIKSTSLKFLRPIGAKTIIIPLIGKNY